EVKTVEELTIDCESGYYYGWKNYRSGILVASFDMAFSMELSSVRSAAPQNPGIGGSLARFTITGDFLFTVDESQLQSVDISNPLTPLLGSKQTVAWGLETIFPYGDKLYIGANTGMHIFSVADPHNPEFMTTFSHVRSCDPVVVEGDYAYVTLRGGTNCRVAGTNQLDVLNIADPLNVKLIKSYALTNPGGLGIDNDILFICDGDAGLKIFDATDKLTISANKLAQYPDVKAIDVIPFNKVLMVIAKDGFYQYDYSDITNISLLSQIPVTFEL
ncbi:MAG: hypothetical protein OEX02_13200, partial [Cyclobacteriaceae bacterium]|nr:hypothetical protein [Cyclobacteriaceae bacterium]